MLLWNDSFGYANQIALEENWLANQAPTPRQEGRLPGSYAVGLNNEWIRLDVPTQTTTGPGLDTAIIGMAVKLPLCTNQSIIFSLFSTGLEERIRVRFRQVPGDTTQYYIEVCRMDSGVLTEVLLQTNLYPVGEWQFFELKVIFSQNGVVEWRSGGYLEQQVQNVRTEGDGFDAGWRYVLLQNGFPGASETLFTDLYVLNTVDATTEPRFARYLGDVSTVSAYPDPSRGQRGARTQWVSTSTTPPASDEKWSIVVMVGQSNMDGSGGLVQGDNPPPAGTRNQNNRVWIWDADNNRTDPMFAFGGNNPQNNTANLSANPSGAVDYHGPEMRFAERIAAQQELDPSQAFVPGNVVILKLAKGNSTLYPNLPALSWDPDTFGNLYNRLGVTGQYSLVGNLTNLVNHLGGWVNIDRLDVVFYQGESDAINYGGAIGLTPAREYPARLVFWFGRLLTDFPQIRDLEQGFDFHITQIHKDLPTSFFPAKEAIRSAHRLIPSLFDNYFLVDVDNIEIGTDNVHYDKNGYAAVGDMMFDSWLARQPLAGKLDDYVDGSSDLSGINIFQEGQDVVFPWTSGFYTRGTEILSARLEFFGSSLGTTANVQAAESDGSAFGYSAGLDTLTIAGNLGRIQMTSSPLTGRGILEEDLQRHDWGFRSA